jgi:hypothetical protein
LALSLAPVPTPNVLKRVTLRALELLAFGVSAGAPVTTKPTMAKLRRYKE